MMIWFITALIAGSKPFLAGKVILICDVVQWPGCQRKTDIEHGHDYSQGSRKSAGKDYRNYPTLAYLTQCALVEFDTATGKVKC